MSDNNKEAISDASGKNIIEGWMDKISLEKRNGLANRRGYTQNQNKDKSANVVCQIKESWLKDQGYISSNDELNILAEQYRSIKRPLLMNATGKGAAPIERGNLIMVASALPGEGKTFTSLNLAISMAMERDTTILLVDGDISNPSLSRMVGVADQPGLTDVLLDTGVNLSDVIYDSSINGLNILPAGQIHPNSTELLASKKMAALTNELAMRNTNRIVLFDSPPLLITSQATVLTHQAGQIVVVVDAGETPQQTVIDALEMLDKEKVIGTVLNKQSWKYGQRNYGYYYGYGSTK
jgi:exopolysaccharide/PEP-CTERM locus tyrosine autokinase